MISKCNTIQYDTWYLGLDVLVFLLACGLVGREMIPSATPPILFPSVLVLCWCCVGALVEPG